MLVKQPGMRSRVRRRGAAATEFACILPVIITAALGAADFGRFVYSDIAVINAARSGAAYGIFNPYDTQTQSNWQSGIRQAANDEMNQAAGFDATKLAVAISMATESDGLQRLTVQVGYPFQTMVQWPLFPNTVNLQQSITMRKIR